jgi:hypothetical protein
MKRVVKSSLLVLGVIVLGVFAFLLTNSISMDRMVDREIKAFISEAESSEIKVFSYKDLEGLPEPVQRYFRYALQDGQAYIRFAKMEMSAKFRRPNEEKMSDITADQYFTTERPGLLFVARLHNYPFWGVWVDVRDGYHHGKGKMNVNILSGLNVLDERDVRELDHTMFLRFVGQAMMCPTALLPSDYVQWEPVDENSARIVVADGDNSGTSLVYLNEGGEITKWVTEGRYEKVGDVYRQVGTIGHHSNYQEVDGIKVPMKVVVERVLSDGTREVFLDGEIQDIQFDKFIK